MKSADPYAYADLFEAHPQPMIIFDSHCRFELMNDRATQLLQGKFERGMDADEFYSAVMDADIGALAEKVNFTDGSVACRTDKRANESREIAGAMAAGALVLPPITLVGGVQYSPLCSRLSNGKYQWILLDETVLEQTPARTAASATTRLFADLIEKLPVGIGIEDAQGILVDCNNAFSRFFDQNAVALKSLSRTERAKTNYELVAEVNGVPCENVPFEAHAQTLNDNAEKFIPYELKLKDGRYLFVERTVSSDGGAIVVLTDTTAVKATQEERLASINDVVEGIEEALVLYDRKGKYVLSNKAYREVYGLTHRPPHPGEPFESVLRRLIDLDFYDLPEGVSKDEFFKAGVETFYNRSANRDFPIKAADGRILLASSYQTRLDGFLLSIRDVTRQEKAEQELAEQRELANQSEKLSALGELLAGVAHELNNPLSVVLGYSQMLQGQLATEGQNEKIDRINQAAERSAKIVKTFLAMARQRPGEMQPSDLAEVIEVAMDVAAYGLRSSGAEIEINAEEDLPQVLIDKDQMAQVFSNLIINAEQAMMQAGRPMRLIVNVSVDRDRNEVIASVEDNGVGIAPHVIPRVFDPFFTTKDVGKGTGFGLAFCHRIVTNHQGKMTVDSRLDRGSKFTLRLPIADLTDKIIPQKRDKSEGGMGRRILIVDDEPIVAALIAETLSNAGYVTSCVNSPADGLERVKRESFDAILSDMKMPGMTGEQFSKALIATLPEYEGRIGFVTGDALTEEVNSFLACEDVSYIKKPIAADELRRLAAKLCNARKAST